jgi:hypothetical protein
MATRLMTVLGTLMLAAALPGQTPDRDPVAEALAPGQSSSSQPPSSASPSGPAALETSPETSSQLPGLPLAETLLALFLLVVIAAVAVWFLWKNRKITPSTSTARNSLVLARERLKALHNLPAETPLAEVATRISLILRHYLAESQSENALYQTHEEFNASEDRLRRMEPKSRKKVSATLEELASAQYTSPTPDANQAKELLARGEATLETIATSTTSDSSLHA